MAHPPCALERLACDPSVALLVVAAHPDDETVGLGAALGRLIRGGARPTIVHVTDGAPRNAELRPTLRCRSREDAATERRAEVFRALAAGGIDAHVLGEPLGIVDQEAAYAMPALARSIAERLRRAPADVVVTHPYEGGHPDHDATALAVHAAVALLGRDAPALAEMTSYHLEDGALATGRFLPSPAPPCDGVLALAPDDDARARRRRMLRAFSSQREVLSAFEDAGEAIRCAPTYDFSRPAHEGPLNYERLGFGWSGATWRALARDALHELGLASDGTIVRA